MSTRKKEQVVNVAVEIARMQGETPREQTDEMVVDVSTVPSPADTFPSDAMQFHAGVQEGGRVTNPNGGVDEHALAVAQAHMTQDGEDAPEVDITPEVGEYVRVSYHRPTGRYCQFNPAHTQRSDFDIRRVLKSELPQMNLFA